MSRPPRGFHRSGSQQLDSATVSRRSSLLFFLIVAGLIVAACSKGTPSASPSASAGSSAPKSVQPSTSPPAEREGIFKLDRLIFIVQENRSFDHYFGTYPGADGLQLKGNRDCNIDPVLGDKCLGPYHDTSLVDYGGPHSKPQSDMDINGGKMDGFIQATLLQPDKKCSFNPEMKSCDDFVGPQRQPDVMGYHTRQELPNYWKYADDFVLQDRMFASVDSWTLPAHLFLVSGWSAFCKDHEKAMSCSSEIYAGVEKAKRGEVPYAWTDITYLLEKAGVSWGWYVSPGTCWNAPECKKGPEGTSSAINVMPGFQTVHENNQLGNIMEHPAFFQSLKDGTLPSVSWVLPGRGFSDHPGNGAPITKGQQWVTSVINAVGKSSAWDSSAIFVVWDDWGGFYDHVKPPRVDINGYGLRVPAFMVSPYAKKGLIDHQTLSFDAYLKLIEDRFLDGQRLNPKNDGRPDPRPTVRENVKILGDLEREFDFNQEPRKPPILDPTP